MRLRELLDRTGDVHQRMANECVAVTFGARREGAGFAWDYWRLEDYAVSGVYSGPTLCMVPRCGSMVDSLASGLHADQSI